MAVENYRVLQWYIYVKGESKVYKYCCSKIVAMVYKYHSGEILLVESFT